MSDKQFTFCLEPVQKYRHKAGEYDDSTHTPKYEIEISAPDYAKNQLTVSQVLIENQQSKLWVWGLENKSTLKIFVSVTKNREIPSSELPMRYFAT